ncbi:hypothetical protein B296_00015519 [Ensete ventricosum]|uniref:Uncharacterized protein n=1 Tax=Ensete ventricosum TaxID=4639 RepID=A0A426YMB2_ENSVE|nr:hypothetical protein B296_00015519 [Ensete ventricosum]
MIGSKSRRCLRGRGGHMHAVSMQRWLATTRPCAGVAGHGLATCKGRSATARPPARAGHPRPALPPAGATVPVAGVADPWQGDCRLQRAAAAYAGAAVATTQ